MASTQTQPSIEEYLDLHRKWHGMHGMAYDEDALRSEWIAMTKHRKAFNLENIRMNVTAAARRN